MGGGGVAAGGGIASGGGAVGGGASGGGASGGGSSGTTTCGVMLNPSAQTPSGSVDVTFASNGSGCTASVDSSPALAVPCAGGSIQLIPNDFCLDVGTHTLTLMVSDGPSGATQCSSPLTVTAGTTCCLTVSPTTGTTSTSFWFSAASNATSCHATLDGADAGAPPLCNQTLFVSGSTIGPGVHDVGLICDSTSTQVQVTVQ